MAHDLLIIGAGISGLAAARRALEANPGTRVALLEASSRAGGLLHSEAVQGFVIEHGPDSLITDRPEALALLEALGLQGEVVRTCPEQRGAYVVHRRRLVRVPEGFSLLAPLRLMPFLKTPLLSPWGKLRAAADLLLPRGASADPSLAELVERRLGRQVLERLAEPLAGGIYGADPHKLSLISTLPRFVAAEAQHRSLILGLRRQDPGRQASGARYGLFVSLRQGLGQLTQRLTDQLAPHLHLQQRAVGLTRRRGLWQVRTHSGQSWTAPRLILALPAWRAADLLRQAQPALAQALAAIRYGSSVSVTLGWHSTEALARPLDAYGLVVPAAEGLPLQAATWSSAKYPGRAPAGGALIRCFFGGHGRRVRTGDSDAALSALALDQLRLLLGRVDAPDIVRVVRYPRALPRYEIGHAGRITAIEDACARAPGLALAGNAYHGIGIAAAIASGHAAADKLAALP